jgi:hypothetical protein
MDWRTYVHVIVFFGSYLYYLLRVMVINSPVIGGGWLLPISSTRIDNEVSAAKGGRSIKTPNHAFACKYTIRVDRVPAIK